MRVDARWERVSCRECGVEYVCTPERDYYLSSTLEDGLCWPCFLRQAGLRADQPEPPYADRDPAGVPWP